MHAKTPFASLEKAAFGRLIGRGLGAAARMVGRNPVKSLAAGTAGYAAANSEPGQNFTDSMAGKFNAAKTNALQGLAATGAGVGAVLSGRADEAGQAADKKWNEYEQYKNQQNQRADQGWNKATGYLEGAGNRLAKPFAMIGAGVQGLSEGGWAGAAEALNNQAQASNGMIAANDKQVATGQQQSWDPSASAPVRKAPTTPATPAAPAAPANPVAAAPATPAAPAAPAAQSPAPRLEDAIKTIGASPNSGGPIQAQLEQFRRGTGTRFNPKSWLDRNKMNALMSGNRNWSDNQSARAAGSNQRYAWANGAQKSASAFAALDHTGLQKEALARGVMRGLGWVGSRLARSGNAAKQLAREAAPVVGGAKNEILDMRNVTNAAKGVGNKRLNMAGKLDDLGKKISDSPKIQKAINYGGGAALGGAGLYGANRMGYSSGSQDGFQTGAGQGLDAGMRAGVESALASQAANQPGYLANLWNSILGQASGGMNADVALGDLSKRRSDILNFLMRNYQG